jgi:tetratricopeptide (TPR) repeat protein
MLQKVILTTMLFSVMQASAMQAASSNSLEQMQQNIYEAYVLSNMPLWEKTLADMEAMYSRVPSNLVLYDILLAQYGIIGYYLGTDQKAKGQHHLDRAEDYAERLMKAAAYRTSALVFQSAFVAFRINLRPIRAVQLGPKSYRLIDQALEADPDNARVWIEKGNAAFYTPSVFGGNKAEAIDHYQKAISLLEENMPNNHRWLYLSTLVALANAYENTGDLPNAIRTAEKALAFEPRFKWVKDELLPAYREKAGR